MALTVGTGPFGRRPRGEFDFAYDAPERVLYFEDSPAVLEPSDHTSHCPLEGDAAYWAIRVGDDRRGDAV